MRWKLLLWLIPVALVGIVIGINRDDDDGGETFTPAEAACRMLEDGDTPDEAYRGMIILLDDLEYSVGDAEIAARAAVDEAVADGC